MSDDWASKTAARLKEAEAQKLRNAEYDMRVRSLISSHAPMLWEDLKAVINQKAAELNEAYGRKLLTVTPLIQNRQDLEVEGPSSARLRLEFNAAVPSVSHVSTKASTNAYATGQHDRGDLMLVVDRDQVWFIKKGESGTYKSVEQAAEYLLSMII